MRVDKQLQLVLQPRTIRMRDRLSARPRFISEAVLALRCRSESLENLLDEASRIG